MLEAVGCLYEMSVGANSYILVCQYSSYKVEARVQWRACVCMCKCILVQSRLPSKGVMNKSDNLEEYKWPYERTREVACNKLMMFRR